MMSSVGSSSRSPSNTAAARPARSGPTYVRSDCLPLRRTAATIRWATNRRSGPTTVTQSGEPATSEASRRVGSCAAANRVRPGSSAADGRRNCPKTCTGRRRDSQQIAVDDQLAVAVGGQPVVPSRMPVSRNSTRLRSPRESLAAASAAARAEAPALEHDGRRGTLGSLRVRRSDRRRRWETGFQRRRSLPCRPDHGRGQEQQHGRQRGSTRGATPPPRRQAADRDEPPSGNRACCELRVTATIERDARRHRESATIDQRLGTRTSSVWSLRPSSAGIPGGSTTSRCVADYSSMPERSPPFREREPPCVAKPSQGVVACFPEYFAKTSAWSHCRCQLTLIKWILRVDFSDRFSTVLRFFSVAYRADVSDPSFLRCSGFRATSGSDSRRLVFSVKERTFFLDARFS